MYVMTCQSVAVGDEKQRHLKIMTAADMAEIDGISTTSHSVVKSEGALAIRRSARMETL